MWARSYFPAAYWPAAYWPSGVVLAPEARDLGAGAVPIRYVPDFAPEPKLAPKPGPAPTALADALESGPAQASAQLPGIQLDYALLAYREAPDALEPARATIARKRINDDALVLLLMIDP